ncbi:MAG: radical SAM protein [Bacillota bacterium]
MKKAILPIFLANAGCLDRCVFCNQRAVERNYCNTLQEEVTAEINRQLLYLTKTDVQLAFYGGTFTALPDDQQLMLLQLGKNYIDGGKISSIRVSTRPDALDDSCVNLLKTFGVTAVEIGAQSLVDSVLIANNRRHTYDDVATSVARVKKSGMTVGIHLMTGLVGETDETNLLTLQRLAQMVPDMLRIHPTIVLRGTKLEQLFLEGKYCPQTMQQAITSASWLKLVAQSKGITVIRTGIQPSEELQNGQVVAGPFHPAFGELCDSAGFYVLLYILLKRHIVNDLFCSPKDLSKIIGQQRKNITRLETKFEKKIILSVSNLIASGTIETSTCSSTHLSSLVEKLGYNEYKEILEDE